MPECVDWQVMEYMFGKEKSVEISVFVVREYGMCIRRQSQVIIMCSHHSCFFELALCIRSPSTIDS